MPSIRMPKLENLPIPDIADKLRFLNLGPAYEDILSGVNTSLVLFDNVLVDTASGRVAELPADEDMALDARLARTAASLLDNGDDRAQILLLLPPADFIATRFEFSISGEKMIRSALNLQVNNLIPAYDEPLLLGLNPASPEGVALWFPQNRANGLFAAFEQEGLQLTAIMPRCLALQDSRETGDEQPQDITIEDHDGRDCTLVRLNGNRISEFFIVYRQDLEIEEFAGQWNDKTAGLPSPAQRFETAEDWSVIGRPIAGSRYYSFFPQGAERLGRKIRAKRRNKLIAASLIFALLLSCYPFIAKQMEIRALEQTVENYRVVVADIIEKQNTIFDIEEEWGAISEYPDQQVSEVLFLLDREIDSLTSFSLARGLLDIQGYAEDPAYLVQTLAEEERFYNVAQSRSISGNRSSAGDRFGIRMNLSGIDFDAYLEDYPEVTD